MLLFASEIFSSGHRNPEGLFVDSGGTIWSTEHGPNGGDELIISRFSSVVLITVGS